jgi:hypothetical protein
MKMKGEMSVAEEEIAFWLTSPAQAKELLNLLAFFFHI